MTTAEATLATDSPLKRMGEIRHNMGGRKGQRFANDGSYASVEAMLTRLAMKSYARVQALKLPMSYEDNMSGKFLVLEPCLRHTSDPRLLKTAFEIEPMWVIRSGAKRQKWIDQSQSLNVFIRQGTKGRDLAEIYMKAWEEGLKTTYYLRSQSKQVQKGAPATPAASALPQPESGNFCSIDNGSRQNFFEATVVDYDQSGLEW